MTVEWVRDSSTAAEQTRRLVIWLTHFGKWHAGEIADMVTVSVQAVWKWVGEYNKRGPSGLTRRGRGGRRWSYLTDEQEEELLRSLEERALAGDVLTAKQILPLACDAAGCEVSLAYVYAFAGTSSLSDLAGTYCECDRFCACSARP